MCVEVEGNCPTGRGRSDLPSVITDRGTARERPGHRDGDDDSPYARSHSFTRSLRHNCSFCHGISTYRASRRFRGSVRRFSRGGGFSYRRDSASTSFSHARLGASPGQLLVGQLAPQFAYEVGAHLCDRRRVAGLRRSHTVRCGGPNDTGLRETAAPRVPSALPGPVEPSVADAVGQEALGRVRDGVLDGAGLPSQKLLRLGARGVEVAAELVPQQS